MKKMLFGHTKQFYLVLKENTAISFEEKKDRIRDNIVKQIQLISGR